MLRCLLATLTLALGLATQPAAAADRADEYPGFARLTDNYELQSRKQNYDAVKFPVSINKSQSVEGEKTIIEYGYRNSSVNASRLQFQRHFEGVMRSLNGEPVFAGRTEEHAYVTTFRFPKNGKTAWAVASTHDSNDIHNYRLLIVETSEAWGGAPAAMPEAKPVGKPAVVEPKAVAPEPKAVAPEPKPAAIVPVVWKGGEWKEVNRGGCDAPDLQASKPGLPDDDLCDADMANKVAVCYSDHCVYKNVTPKQCKGGSKPGRMYVCAPK
jgi:hypothetical protein